MLQSRYQEAAAEIHAALQAGADLKLFVAAARHRRANRGDLHAEIGAICSILGATSEAVRMFEQSIALGHNNARVSYNLGMLYYRLGEVDRAEAMLQAALAFDPALSRARKNLEAIQALNRRGRKE